MPVDPLLTVFLETLLTGTNLNKWHEPIKYVLNFVLLVYEGFLQFLELEALSIHVDFMCFLQFRHHLFVVGCQTGIVIVLISLYIHNGSIFLAVVRLSKIHFFLDLMEV